MTLSNEQARECLKRQDIWIHQGKGILPDDFKFHPVTPGDDLLTGVDTILTDKVFDNRFVSGRDQVSFKPKDAIWFSRGSWLYDPFYSDCEGACEQLCAYGKVLAIKNPRNILAINTVKELLDFVNKYGRASPYYGYDVDWNRVAQDYDGLALNFRKYYEAIGYDDASDEERRTLREKCSWQLSFDVESLVIFNIRSLEQVYALDLNETRA